MTNWLNFARRPKCLSYRVTKYFVYLYDELIKCGLSFLIRIDPCTTLLSGSRNLIFRCHDASEHLRERIKNSWKKAILSLKNLARRMAHVCFRFPWWNRRRSAMWKLLSILINLSALSSCSVRKSRFEKPKMFSVNRLMTEINHNKVIQSKIKSGNE